jgi:colanic acid biosynthesis glycosyl transferase WcaI
LNSSTNRHFPDPIVPPKRITFIEQYYFPEGWGGAQLPRDVTVELARAGYAVSVLCGLDQYDPSHADSGDDPAKFGIVVIHLPRPFLRFRSGTRVFNQLWFCLTASAAVAFRKRPAVFVVQTNPPLMAVVLSVLAIVARRPVIIIAQDLYPEVMIANGMITETNFAGRFLGAVFRWTFRRAARVVSIGPKMTERLVAKGVPTGRIHEISNWATGDLEIASGSRSKLVNAWGLAEKFVLVYSGNLGIAHDHETMIRAVGLASSSIPNLRLLIIGRGARLSEAQDLVAQLRLDDVIRFQPSVSPGVLPHALGIAKFGVVTILPGFDGLVVPSKLLGHMARGVPTLYVGPCDSDVANILAESGGGISFRNGEHVELAGRIASLASDSAAIDAMGANGKSYYRQYLARHIGLTQYRRMIESVIGGSTDGV